MYETGINLVLKEDVSAKLRVILPLLESANKHFLLMDQIAQKSAGLRQTATALGAVARNLVKVNEAGGSGMPTAISNLNQISNKSAIAAEKISLLGKSMGVLNNALHLFSRLGLAMFGFSMLKEGITQIAEPAMAAAQIKAKMRMTGIWSAQQAEQAEVTAKSMVNLVPGISVTQGLQMQLESGSIFADADRARKLAPTFGRAQQIMTALAGMPGFGKLGGQEIGFAKAIAGMAEQSGVVSAPPAVLNKFIDGVIKILVRTGGAITPQMLQMQWSRLGAAKYMVNPEDMMTQLSHRMQEAISAGGGGGGASKSYAGVQGKAFLRAFVGGVIPKQAYKDLAGIGLITGGVPGGTQPTPGHPISWSSTSMMSGQIRDKQLLLDDQNKWADKQRREVLNKQFPGFLGMDSQKQGMLLYEHLGKLQTNAQQWLFELLMTPTWQNIERQIEAQNKQPGTASLGQMAEMTPEVRIAYVQTSWDKLLTSIGESPVIMRAATVAFEGTIAALTAADNWVNKFNATMSQIAAQKEMTIFLNSLKDSTTLLIPVIGHMVNLLNTVSLPLATAGMHLFEDIISQLIRLGEFSKPKPEDKFYRPDTSHGLSKFGAAAGAEIMRAPPIRFPGQIEWGRKIGRQLGAYAGQDWHIPGMIAKPLHALGLWHSAPNKKHPLLDQPFNWGSMEKSLPIPTKQPAHKEKLISMAPVFHITNNFAPLSGFHAEQVKQSMAEALFPAISRLNTMAMRSFNDISQQGSGSYIPTNLSQGAFLT
jgi:hypothetical protein